FHAVVPRREDLASALLNPRYLISLDQFEECVTYFLSAGFRAVSPLDILKGLPSRGRFVLFTFDDGYANNTLVLPVLERHRVPALFALATDFIVRQRAYW